MQTVTIVGVLASERVHAEQAMRSIADALMRRLFARATPADPLGRLLAGPPLWLGVPLPRSMLTG